MPNVSMPRSRFVRPQSHKTTFDAGRLIPFYIDEVLPGDTHKIETSYLVRTQPLVAPIMDNIWLDTFYFFVPNRLVWNHWEEFMGENKSSAWLPDVEYSVPQIEAPEGGFAEGTIADYFGIPTNVDGISVNALPFRMYAKIVQEFFRDENLTDPLNIPENDSTQTGSNGDNYINDVANGGMPFKVAKYHDVFTSSLPAPQKGPEVSINLGQISGSIPVVGNGYGLGLTDGTNNGAMFANGASTYIRTGAMGNSVGTAYSADAAMTTKKIAGVPTAAQLGDNLNYSGLIADLDASGIGSESIITIAQLRQAFAIQRFYETSARSGSRYIETLKAHFGVTSPDARLQRPEYLGGSHTLINVNQVVQTSQTSEDSALGDTAAYSVTTDYNQDFTHSFVEHGFIIGLACVRYEHSYQQGIERMWSRKSIFDYYWPLLANLSEVGVKNREIYAQGDSVINEATGKPYDDEIFGYQEAWYEYRYKPNRVSAEMRSNYQTSLDMWHLADYYSQLPSLSDSWIREDPAVIDRSLAVTSNVSAQFFGDFYIKDIATRCMPIYSIPGLTRL